MPQPFSVPPAPRRSGLRAAHRRATLVVVAIAVWLASTAALPFTGPVYGATPPQKHPTRLIRIERNLLGEHVDEIEPIVKRAAAAGFDAVVFADSKLENYWAFPNWADQYREKLKWLRQLVTSHGMQFIVTTVSLGKCTATLVHDVNLAAAMPVREAPLRVSKGVLLSTDPARVTNGSFEQLSGLKPSGWELKDRSMPFISAAFGNNVHHSARRPPILRVIVGRLHPKFVCGIHRRNVSHR